MAQKGKPARQPWRRHNEATASAAYSRQVTHRPHGHRPSSSQPKPVHHGKASQHAISGGSSILGASGSGFQAGKPYTDSTAIG